MIKETDGFKYLESILLNCGITENEISSRLRGKLRNPVLWRSHITGRHITRDIILWIIRNEGINTCKYIFDYTEEKMLM